MMNCCNYWLRNLSQGRNFYSSKAKVHENKEIFVVVGARAFKVYKRSSKDYSYSLNSKEINELEQCFKNARVQYSLQKDTLQCEIKGTPQDPAAFRVNFIAGDNLYNIKNYNGFEITREEANEIRNVLPEEYKAEILRWCSTGYFKMNIPVAATKVDKKQEVKKENVISKIIETQKEKYHQISIFEMMAAKA